MALTSAPASALDFLEALDAAGGGFTVRERRRFGLLARQVSASAAITVRDEAGALCLIAGVYMPDGEDVAYAWFAPGPALRANLLAAVRLWRAMFEAAMAGVAPITVRVDMHPGGVAGPRLAAWFGFSEAAGPGRDGRPGTWERRFGHHQGHLRHPL